MSLLLLPNMENNFIIQNNNYHDYCVMSHRYYVTTKNDLLCELGNFTQTCCVSLGNFNKDHYYILTYAVQ